MPEADERAQEVVAEGGRASASVRSVAAGARENFWVLSPLVKGDLRRDFSVVYADCRGLDDAADAPGRAGETEDEAAARRGVALEELRRWRSALRRAFAAARGGSGEGEIEGPGPAGLWSALAEVARRRGLEERPFVELIEAFERDQRQLEYETWDDLESYCRKSADPVGRIVLRLGGVDEGESSNAEIVRRSDAVCTGLQLVNHLQDVRRDLLQLGRVYLPSAETGLSKEELVRMSELPGEPADRVRFIRAVRPLLERTEQLFGEARGLAGDLRSSGQGNGAGIAGAVWLFRAGGLATCGAVSRAGCATLWVRPRVGRATRLRLLAEAWLRFGLR